MGPARKRKKTSGIPAWILNPQELLKNHQRCHLYIISLPLTSINAVNISHLIQWTISVDILDATIHQTIRVGIPDAIIYKQSM